MTQQVSRTLWCGAAGLAVLLLGVAAQRGTSAPPEEPSYLTWSDYGGTADSAQYSSLTQINKGNVSRLEQAWFYHAPGPGGRFSFNPLVVDGVMYVVGKDSAILALDAATGKQIWSHTVEGNPTNRGFNYWESKDRSDRRLIYAANSYLQQIDVRTGVTIPSFGNDGKVDLREGLGRDPKTIDSVQSGTPGRVFENLIILGSAPGEAWASPPGDLRAYDVLSGKLVWTFHTIPRPGEFGYDTWPPDAWKYTGGANTWGEISIDEKRGIAYFPLGSPTYDLYGADRIGANLFGNCLLALDARTGKRLWHFQTVHHDLWDYDLVTAPKLLTVRHNGEMVDIVAQATKTGMLFVFNRVTGEPLWPIEERPVPQGTDMPGEEVWPTQPFPTKPPPFARQQFPLEDLNPYLDPEEAARLKLILLNARNEGIYTPPSRSRNHIQIPGSSGGANWGSTAVDPATGMLYVRTFDAPSIRIMTKGVRVRRVEGGTPAQQGFALYIQNCVGCHGSDRAGLTAPRELGMERFVSTVRDGKEQMPAFSEDTLSVKDVEALAAYLNDPAAGEIRAAGEPDDPSDTIPGSGLERYYGPFGAQMLARNGYSAISPPWTELVAYDLNEGAIKWRIPLGTTPGLAAKGITNSGSLRARNGPVVTAGGLIFVATSPDRMIRAYDKDTGRTLWETEIEANPDGIPAVYEVNGRQYVAFFAAAKYGGQPLAAKQGKPEAQGYYVFALPEETPDPRKQ